MKPRNQKEWVKYQPKADEKNINHCPMLGNLKEKLKKDNKKNDK